MLNVETPDFQVVDAPRSQVGESPLWCPVSRRLWWVDIEGRAIFAYDIDTERSHVWHTAERPASLALHGQGGLLVAMETGVFHWKPGAHGALEGQLLAAVDHPRGGMRFNDGRCDRVGRFWVSSMVRDMALGAPAGILYCLDATGVLHPRWRGLVTGNGLAFSPCGKRLYLSDSHPSVRRIWAFDLGDEGQLTGQREFADLSGLTGRPDGAAVDAQGGYWSCANDGGALWRFGPDGVLDRQLRLPFAKPSMCAFGGPDFGTLYVTSIRASHPGAGFDPALAGAVIAIHPGVRGLPERPYGVKKEGAPWGA